MRSVLVALITLSSAAVVAAPVPLVVGHSGFLLDAQDRPVTAPSALLTFSLWRSADTADVAFRTWPATGDVSCTTGIEAGHYTVALGSEACGAGLSSDDLPFGAPRYLEVSVNGVKL